jgi:hypothetical protein
MKHAEDLEPLAMIAEADAVVAQAEAQLRWIYITQTLDVAVTGENVIGQPFEQTQRGLTIDPLHVGARYPASTRSVSASGSAGAALSALLTHAVEVVHGETEVGENLFVWDALATVFAQPLLGFFNRALFLLTDLFLVKHGFEQSGDRRQLRGRQPVN